MTRLIADLTGTVYQDWTVQHSWSVNPAWGRADNTVTATSRGANGLPLWLSVSLTVRPGDRQWDVMDLLTPQHPEVNAAVLQVLLPRMHHLLAAQRPGSWQVELLTDGFPAPALLGRPRPEPSVLDREPLTWRHNRDLTGEHARLEVVAAASRDYLGQGEAAVAAATLLHAATPIAQQRLLQQVLAHITSLPQLPAPDPDWPASTAAFAARPLPGEPHPGQFVVVQQASRGRADRHVVDTLDQARNIAAHRPYNTTFTTVHEVTGIDTGRALTRELPTALWKQPPAAGPAASSQNSPVAGLSRPARAGFVPLAAAGTGRSLHQPSAPSDPPHSRGAHR